MDTKKVVALMLLIGGALALGYGGFTYTKANHSLDVGSLHVSVDEKQRVNVPIWAGVAAMLMGGVMLSVGRRN